MEDIQSKLGLQIPVVSPLFFPAYSHFCFVLPMYCLDNTGSAAGVLGTSIQRLVLWHKPSLPSINSAGCQGFLSILSSRGLLFIAKANIFHGIGSSRHSEPYTDLSNTIGRISVKIIIVAILQVDGSLSGGLAMPWSTLALTNVMERVVYHKSKVCRSLPTNSIQSPLFDLFNHPYGGNDRSFMFPNQEIHDQSLNKSVGQTAFLH